MNNLCQVELEIQFYRQCLRNALEINISKVTCRSVRNTELFLEKKVTKREQRTIEILINNELLKKKHFTV